MKYLGIVTLFTFLILSPVYAQQSYLLPDDLQPITPENVTQLTPLAQLGNAAPRGVAWSPDGQTLLATTDDGTYRYQLNALDSGEFFAGIQNLGYNSTETYAISDGNLLDGDSFEVIDSAGNQRFISDGHVIVTSELVGDRHILHFADAETLVEFGTISAWGSIVLSEDRRRAALWSGGEYLPDGTDEIWLPYHMELWDIESNTLLAEDDYTLDYFYPPQFSGQWLIVGDNGDLVSGSIQVWNAETGELVMNMLSGYVNSTPTISPDGRFMLLEGYAAELISLDGEFPSLNLTPDSDYEGQIYNGFFSADGALLAVETSTGIALYDLSETPPQAYADEIEDGFLIGFGRQSHMLLTGNNEVVQTLWDVGDTGVNLHLVIEPSNSFTAQQAFSPNDDFLVTTDGRFVETATGEVHYTFSPYSNPEFNVDWSYAAYWQNGVLTLVDMRDGTEHVLMTVQNNLGRVMEINSKSELALFYGDDLVMRLYDMRTGDLRFEIGEVAQAHFNENGTRLMVISVDYTSTTLWDVGGATPVSLLTIDAPIRAHAFSADGHLFALITTSEPPINYPTLESHTLEVWDVDNAVQIGQQVIQSLTLPSLSVSPDNHWLAVTSDYAVQFYELDPFSTTPDSILQFPSGPPVLLQPDHVQFSHDGQTVAIQLFQSVIEGNANYLLYLASLDQILSGNIVIGDNLEMVDRTESVSFSADDSLLLTHDFNLGSFEPPPQLHLRDINGQDITDFDTQVGGFSLHNDMIATGSLNSVQLWDVASLQAGSTESLVTLDNVGTQGLSFSDDGTLLFIYEPRRVTVWGIGES